MLPIEKACYWMATAPTAINPALQDTIKVDIAIIGAGFTGLWTAFFLKEIDPSVDIAIVEKEIAGYGGSGRNAGMLSQTIDHSHELAITHFGQEEAKLLAKIGQENVREMQNLFAQQLNCDYEATGRLYVALTQKQVEDCKRTIEAAAPLGITHFKILDAAQTQAEIRSPLYLGAISSTGGGILNPMKLINGLKQFAKERGVRIFEKTPVCSVQPGRIETGQGRIDAEKVILATDAYSHCVAPELLHRFIPLYDYIIVSEPLTDSQMELIGWKKRQGVTDARTFFNYYRLTSDNRILWGTSEAQYYPPNRVDASCDHSEKHYDALKKSFANHFPQIRDIKFEFAWGGPIASTTRLTPFFGTLHNGHTLYALGYTGHGIGSTRLAAKILAHQALGKTSELLSLAIVRNKPIPYPPEPFRKFAVDAVTKALRNTDQGGKENLLLKILNRLGIGFSS
jgi:glycine/D-amino acid oxidase-like deaminating enzyme